MQPAGFNFRGTERYAVQRQLGAGTFGVVYQAYDRERQERVALKVLKRLDPARVYAFKREFRAIAGVVHENLVKLYELVQQEREWFFTMELVEGQTFMKYVRPKVQSLAPTSSEPVASAPTLPVTPKVSYDERRLRAAFSQLTAGLMALHASGHLHRDIKPSNALVAGDGRVVLLDFGLVKEWGPEGSIDERVIGSVGYMSPEQGTGDALTPASDLYAVGAMMYQALTGRLPHLGDIFEVLVAKRTKDPELPERYGLVPADLQALCMQLLDRDPTKRPSGAEVIERLGAPERRVKISSPKLSEVPSRRTLFIGRDSELGALDDAFSDVVDGNTSVVCLHGSSGMGKSALLEEYLNRIRQHATVLRSVCYERESVPYKALDSLMDALTRYLKGLSRLGAEQLMPREVRALARLFPVLDRVGAVAEFPTRSRDIPELQELRLRAISALRELLSRMSDHRPLVLSIDDVQWGDLDSVNLLKNLLAPPDAPPLLLILSYRTEEVHRSPFLRTLLPALRDLIGGQLTDVEIKPLNKETGTLLAMALFGKPELEREPAVRMLAEQVAVEAMGSPFFIRELTAYLLSQDIQTLASSGLGVTLDQVVSERLATLSPPAKRLLEVVAVASRPIPEGAAVQAARIRGDAQSSAVQLRGARFVRTGVSGGEALIETYHDRIRKSVLASLSPEELVQVHLQLAHALEASDAPDAESLAFHFHAAGHHSEAAHYATLAAEQAFLTLAFDRAAKSYRMALDLGAAKTSAELPLRERLAESLAYAGRGQEAARAYMAAVSLANRERGLELKCRAAQQYFFSGKMLEGTELFNEVLEGADLPAIPKSDRGSLFELLRRRLQLRLRGFNTPSPGNDTPRQRLRTDICYAVSASFGAVRPITAISLQTHHLLLALEAGEPFRVARGLGLEAIFSSMAGAGNRRRTRELIERAHVMAGRLDGPEGEAFLIGAEGLCAYFEGNWRKAVERLVEAENALSSCAGLSYELGQTRGFLGLALFYAGDIAQAGRHVFPLVQDARTRGDRQVGSLLVNVSCRSHLFRNEIAAARDELSRGLSGFYDSFTIQDYEHRIGQTRIALYCGDGDEAWSIMERDWKRMVRAGVMRLQVMRVEAHQLRAQAALLRASRQPAGSRRRLIKAAAADAKRIEDEDVPWCRAVAMLLRAAIADLQGRRDEGLVKLRAAERACEECNMGGFAAAARWCRGHLRGGEPGLELVGSSEHWMAEQDIRNPARFSRLLVPGFLVAR